jgi:hypothetical protein
MDSIRSYKNLWRSTRLQNVILQKKCFLFLKPYSHSYSETPFFLLSSKMLVPTICGVLLTWNLARSCAWHATIIRYNSATENVPVWNVSTSLFPHSLPQFVWKAPTILVYIFLHAKAERSSAVPRSLDVLDKKRNEGTQSLTRYDPLTYSVFQRLNVRLTCTLFCLGLSERKWQDGEYS